MHLQELERQIRVAFEGVRLGRGVSLRQTQIITRFGDGVTAQEYASLPNSEVTDDWSRVSFEELEQGAVAHLDAEGLRYYLPALMLSVLSNYDNMSQRVIGTLMALDPRKDYNTMRLSLLSEPQRAAIASFLVVLPQCVKLDEEDRKRVSRSLSAHWSRYVGPSSSSA
jgi:hypothetical protein